MEIHYILQSIWEGGPSKSITIAPDLILKDKDITKA